jgi:hypothetical protein
LTTAIGIWGLLWTVAVGGEKAAFVLKNKPFLAFGGIRPQELWIRCSNRLSYSAKWRDRSRSESIRTHATICKLNHTTGDWVIPDSWGGVCGPPSRLRLTFPPEDTHCYRRTRTSSTGPSAPDARGRRSARNLGRRPDAACAGRHAAQSARDGRAQAWRPRV